MINLIVTALAIAILPLAVVLIKSPGALLFLMLMAGEVIEKQFGETTRNVVGSLTPASKLPVNEITSVAVFLLPAFLAMFLLRKTTSSKSFVFQILAAVAAGVVLVHEVDRLGSRSMQRFLEKSTIWQPIHTYYWVALLAGLILTFIAFWLNRNHDEGHKRFGKKHKG